MTSMDSEEHNRANTKFWLLAILMLATVLRLIRLGTFDYWHDEVHNLLASENLYATVIEGKLISNHPPLPYVLVAAWRAIGLGYSEWTMRGLPALAGVATVGTIFLLVRRLFDVRTALIAAFLLAISPLHIAHSQDLKEYIYLPFVACFIGLFFYQAIDTNRWRDWLLYGLFAGLGCYTEIFVGPLLVALNLWALVLIARQRDRLKGWIAGNVLGAGLFLPWLGIMYHSAVNTMIEAKTWWVQSPSVIGIIFYIKAVAFGYTAPQIYKASLVIFGILICAGLVIAIRRNPRAGTFIAVWSIVPVAIVYLISLKTESIFLIRAMLPYALGLYIAVAVAIAAIPARGRYLPLIVLAGLSTVGSGYYYLRIYPPVDFPHRPGIHPPRDYHRTAQTILDQWQDGDVVVHSTAATWLPFAQYGFRNRPQYFAGVGAKFINDIRVGNPGNAENPVLNNYFPNEPQTITHGAHRVWFVFSEWERKYLEGNATAVWSWLDAHYTEVDRKEFRGIDLILYEQIADAPVLQRDNDDGVSADLSIGGEPNTYHKVLPDTGLIPRGETERRGDLLVKFKEQGQSQPSASTKTEFTIQNRSKEQRTVDIFVVASDVLLSAASLYEADAADEIWHVFLQHNPQPPPPNYMVPVASAHFSEPGTGTLVGELTCPPGTYATRLFMMGAPGDKRHGRSELTFVIGDVDLAASIALPADDTLRWDWFQGASVFLGGARAPVRVTATNPGPEPAYCDVAYVALLREEPGATPNEPLAINRVLNPGETWTHATESTRPANRMDILVYEQAPNGKMYHIFRIADQPKVMGSLRAN
ncbi:MAG: glycosyltransferase family 39 protein [Candidatus Hydrogenedentes bacterium]|nr:glycosyltransferase family 39 protein [Candidatus Hydrogenedentota bacterium]